MLRGSEALIETCKRRIHPEQFHTNAEGTLSWEEVECQGACVNAPMVMIGKDTYEDLTPERLEEIIDAFEAGKGASVKPGPQIDRIYSAPVGGPTTLLEDAPKMAAKKATSSTVKIASTAASVKPKKKPVEKNVESGNATMNVAATASGRAKPPVKKAEAAAPSLDDKNRPAGIDKPARPDDLKMISGVGPKIEGTLHSLGIYTFKQISGWKKAEREWIDNYLKFKGRIEREDWVKQAKALAKGGRDEYVKVFGKEPR
jgi:NADH-quinone oxidoreductase subunit E